MNKNTKEERLNQVSYVASKVNGNVYLKAIQGAFSMTFPLTIFGSFLVVLLSFSYFFDAWQGSLYQTISPILHMLLLVSPLVAFGMGYHLYGFISSKDSAKQALTVGFVSMVALFLLLGDFDEGISIDRLYGGTALFFALIVGIFSVHVYLFIQKMVDTKPLTMGDKIPPAVITSTTSLLPVCCTLLMFSMLSILFRGITLESLVYDWIQRPLMQVGNHVVLMMLVLLMIQVLWFFGIHGHQVVYPVMDGVWLSNSYENMFAFIHKEELPYIVTKQFIEVFSVSIGSMGALSVALVILLVSKQKMLRGVARAGIVPAFFNVSEPILFGLPIVMTPRWLIPWILGTPVVGLMAYLAMRWGWVPYTTGASIPWTTPLGLSGLLATGSWRGAVLQLVQFFILMILWLPFILVGERKVDN